MVFLGLRARVCSSGLQSVLDLSSVTSMVSSTQEDSLTTVEYPFYLPLSFKAFRISS